MHSGTTSSARTRTPQMHADREVGPRGNPEFIYYYYYYSSYDASQFAQMGPYPVG